MTHQRFSNVRAVVPRVLFPALLLIAATSMGGAEVAAAQISAPPAATTPGAAEARPAVAAVGAPTTPGATANEKTVVRRFALITGASQGGPGRVRLRFATSDARAMRHVLSDLGGLGQSETVLMMDVGRTQMRTGFDQMKEKVAAARAPGSRTEMIFYYSGHSDETGLMLGNERVSYAEIRGWVEETGADVRIAVLDSCASGALTRGKGGVHRPPFLVDTSSAARGHAYLTASAENEAAQESDRLGAAYFTHYLVSGLRGAADVSHDGRVTLSEAYQYAFTETLARTEASRGGPQHASYDFQLAGKGDLVMTDLRATSASMLLPPEMSGRLFVRGADGQLIAEVHKLPAQPIELGLPPGRYRVTLDDNRRLSEAVIDLGVGRRTTLAQSFFVAMVPVATTSRGSGGAGDPREPGADVVLGLWPRPQQESAERQPVHLSIFPGFDTTGGRPTSNNLVLGFFARSASVNGLSLTLGHYALGDTSGAAFAAIGNMNGGDVRGTRFAGIGNVTRGNVRGVDVAGVGNLTFGSMRGLQLAGSINWTAGTVNGGQIAGAMNVALGGRGLQLTGGANLLGGDFVGGQIAGGANVAARGGHVRGLQLAGAFNVAGQLAGAQIAVVNVGGDVHGAQIGIVNVARKVHGAQFGLVNVADDVEGVSFGLVTLVRDGIHDLDLSTTEVGGTVLGGLLGSRRFYTRLGVGVLAAAGDIPGGRTVISGSNANRTHYLFQWGFGSRFTLSDRWNLDAEFAGTQYYRTSEWHQEEAATGSLRLLASVRLASSLRVVFGPTYNAAVGWNGTDLVTNAGVLESVQRDGQTTVRMYPGFLVGLRI